MEKLNIRVVAILFGTLWSLGRAAHADTKIDEARARVQSGTELYDENNFRGALVEFQRAYELAPSYKILFNIAQVELELQDYAGALTAYTRYLREGGPDVPPDRVTQVSAEIERLKGRVGHVTIQTAAGAEVLIDDVSIGYAPLPEAAAVNAGQHKIVVHAAGRDPVTRIMDVAGRQDVTVALDKNAPGTPAIAGKPAPEGPRSNVPMYVAWSVAGGFAIASGVSAMVARSDANELATLRGSFPVTQAALEAQRSKTARAALLTDGLAVAAIVSGGVALYLTLTRSHEGATIEKPRAVELQIGPTGLAVAGQF
jgi:hypothetical protein